jgi:hypothetical protein
MVAEPGERRWPALFFMAHFGHPAERSLRSPLNIGREGKPHVTTIQYGVVSPIGLLDLIETFREAMSR